MRQPYNNSIIFAFSIFLWIVWLLLLSVFAKADAPFEQGIDFYQARGELIIIGWKPLTTFTKFENGELENDFGEALTYKQNNFIEIESCSGTGEQYCIFNYQKSSECLRVVTQGMYDPKTNSPVVINWKTVDCSSLTIK